MTKCIFVNGWESWFWRRMGVGFKFGNLVDFITFWLSGKFVSCGMFLRWKWEKMLCKVYASALFLPCFNVIKAMLEHHWSIAWWYVGLFFDCKRTIRGEWYTLFMSFMMTFWNGIFSQKWEELLHRVKKDAGLFCTGLKIELLYFLTF